jgi:hypothetical protein
MKKLIILFVVTSISLSNFAQYSYKIALLKYSGGGDWYANPTSLPNLIKYCNQNLKMNIDPVPATVEPGSPEIFNYPFVHMTGHGNVKFSSAEMKNLRTYLMGGGFLHIDDNYGMDEFIRPQLKKLFPESEMVELSNNNPIFHQKYDFPEGLPKIHEHDNKKAQAFGIFFNERLICLYSYECDLGDGWEDLEVHHDSEQAHEKALKMGANLLDYVFGK